MKTYHLGIAYDTVYDEDFVKILEEAAADAALTTYRIYPWNLDETYWLIRDGSLVLFCYYDRASDTSPQFYKLYELMKEKKVPIFQTLEKQLRASDKALMHKQFQQTHIPVPRTLIVERPEGESGFALSEKDLKFFRRPFIVKPAINTGAAAGVNLHAYSIEDIYHTCQVGDDSKYLVQQKIEEKRIGKRKFWFRVFYVCGRVFSCWWDPQTHRYERVTARQIKLYHLQPLASMIKKIAEHCELQFFSTELACDALDRFFAIDYVNEICDMRLQSLHDDGVPDDLVREISIALINYVKKNTLFLTDA